MATVSSNKPLLKPGDRRKRAVVETVRSVLDCKGGDVWYISPDATVYEALSEMATREVGALPVVIGDRLVGIVSERDYARKVILQARSSKETPVRDIMTPSPATVSPETSVDACLRMMTFKKVRHLPVLDDGKLAGIVSMGDLVAAIISAQAYTIDQLHTYIAGG
jgi:CBS-domain-containing membrane protein